MSQEYRTQKQALESLLITSARNDCSFMIVTKCNRFWALAVPSLSWNDDKSSFRINKDVDLYVAAQDPDDSADLFRLNQGMNMLRMAYKVINRLELRNVLRSMVKLTKRGFRRRIELAIYPTTGEKLGHFLSVERRIAEHLGSKSPYDAHLLRCDVAKGLLRVQRPFIQYSLNKYGRYDLYEESWELLPMNFNVEDRDELCEE